MAGTLLLNYPRSGSNMLCNLVDYFGIYLPKNHGQNVNFWENNIPNVDNLIFLVRNYKEAIPRHTGSYEFGSEFKGAVANRKATSNAPQDHHFDYILPLKYFDQYQGNKILVYYEDLIADPAKEVRRVLDFIMGYTDFTYNNEKFGAFVDELPALRGESLKKYGENISQPQTNGRQAIHHSNKISNYDRLCMDNLVHNKFPEIARKYLNRYKENE